MSLFGQDVAVSVILPCYNAVHSLGPTILSVLEQSFSAIELICIDDGSVDDTYSHLLNWRDGDHRVVVLKNEKNIGLTKSLNLGIKAAKGKYIARLDVGDIYLPEKLQKQVVFLNSNPSYVICATQVCYSDDNGDVEGFSSFALDDKDIRRRFFTRENVFSHPTIMFRNNNFFYDERYRYSQDLELYMNLSRFGKLHCLSEPLVRVWNSREGLTVTKRYYQRQYQNILYGNYRRYYSRRVLPPYREEVKIRSTFVGRKMCSLSMLFFYQYKVIKSGSKSPFLWGPVLMLALFLYPPFLLDYFSRLWCFGCYAVMKREGC